MLTQERLKELFDYDQSTGLFTRKITAGGKLTGSIAGAVHSNGYIRLSVDGTSYRSHRLAWLYVFGSWPADQIDHKNGKKDDNRLSNLREVTRGENAQNKIAPQKNNLAGLLGVKTDKRRNTYAARIRSEGKDLFLGSYKTKEEAHDVYLRAKNNLHIEVFIGSS